METSWACGHRRGVHLVWEMLLLTLPLGLFEIRLYLTVLSEDFLIIFVLLGMTQSHYWVFYVAFLNVNFPHRHLYFSLQVDLSERMNLIPSLLPSLPFPSIAFSPFLCRNTIFVWWLFGYLYIPLLFKSKNWFPFFAYHIWSFFFVEVSTYIALERYLERKLCFPKC